MENGERQVLLLPAYINRSIADQVLVQDVASSVDTVKRALDILSETLDPPTDQYSAMQSLSHTTCSQVNASKIFSSLQKEKLQKLRLT